VVEPTFGGVFALMVAVGGKADIVDTVKNEAIDPSLLLMDECCRTARCLTFGTRQSSRRFLRVQLAVTAWFGFAGFIAA
jgi:hypothetical protein